jgi:hypothetical protein
VFGDSKSIFASKTFWLNVAGIIATVAGGAAGILPPQYAAIAMGVANILNRFLTVKPVTLLPQSK